MKTDEIRMDNRRTIHYITTDNLGTVRHFRNGILDRADGPACEWADGGAFWFIRGKELTEEEFNARTVNA